MKDYLATVAVMVWGVIMFSMAMLVLRSRDRELAEEAKRQAEAEAAAHPPTSAPESR